MTYTTSSIADFLENVEYFRDLPAAKVRDIAAKGQALRYRLGQVMMMREKMSSQVLILVEGKARSLGYDPRNQIPITLELLEPGAIIGAVNLVRLLPCETAIASTECVCLAIDNSNFKDLLKEYPQLNQKFHNQCALIELFDLIGYQLEQQARGEGNLKELALKIAPDSEIYHLPPGKHDFNQAFADNHKVCLVSGGGTINNYPHGSRLQPESNQIEVIGGIPARLVRIPESHWLKITQEWLKPRISPQTDHAQTVDITEGASNPQIAASTLDVEEGEIPYAEVEVLEPTHRKTESRPISDYPFVSGKTPLDAGLACFQMISKYFGMPFRRDVIRRSLANQIDRGGNLSLPFCGAMTELMGLNAQLINVPAQFITRLSAPFLVQWQDSLAIIYEVSDRSLVIAVPEIGILKRDPADFIETWGQEGQVLLLQPTKETPQKRFGLGWFIPALSRYRQVLLEVFVASFFVQLFALANPLMVQIIIDKVIVQNSPDTLEVLGFFLVGIAIVEAFLTYFRTALFVDTTNRIDMGLGSEIIDHLLRLPLRYFEKRPVGEISTRVNELENIRQFLTGTALTVVLDVVFSIVYVIAMLLYSPYLTLWALGIVPVYLGMTIIFAPIIRHQLRVKAEKNAETQSYLVEVMSGIQTVKAQNIELRSRWQWQERYASYVSAGFKTVQTSTAAGAASGFFNKFSGLLVLWIGASLVLQGKLSLGQLIAFRIIAGYVTSPILRLGQLWQNFQEVGLSLERLADIVDTPQEAEEDRTNIPMPAIIGAIRYEDICFRFKQNMPLQLHNINLEFPPGTFVGVVGQSGAGKSTLTKLISRLYEPESGRILIDGYDINKVELYSLRAQIGVVPQDTLLFDGTVQYNISLTNPDATTEQIIEAARVAAAHEFIMNLPNGYNTRVGERGASLSGGQRQRIAIARSVLQNPRMLILDEATSALDYATEHEVSRNLAETFRDRTIFFITHRLATIKHADAIVMMDKGSVVELGTHQELMALKGYYYYLYHQQESSL